MPIYSVQGPDGRIYDVEGPAGASEAQIIAVVKAQLAAEPQGKTGLGAALGKGTESTLSQLRSGLAGLIGSPEEAARAGLERGKKIGEEYADQVDLEKVKKAYEERGVLPAAGEAIRQIPYAIAEQAPNIAATVGGARLGAGLGSVFGPVGTVVGGVAGAAAPSFLQQLGGNIERQAKEGKPVELAPAAAAAVPQAALDVAGSFIPLGGRVVSKITGIPLEGLLGRTAAQTSKLAEERLLATLAKGTATGALAEIPTEIAQQILERAQAGLPLTDESALKEYGETAYQVGLLAPLGAAGRLAERGGARADVARQQALEKRQAQLDQMAQEEQDRQQREATEAAETARKQTLPYALEAQQAWTDMQQQVTDLQVRSKAKVEDGDLIGQADKADAIKQLQALKKSDAFKQTRDEFRRVLPILQQAQAQQAQADQQRAAQIEAAAAQEVPQTAAQQPYYQSPQGVLPGFEAVPPVAAAPTAPTPEAKQQQVIDFAQKQQELKRLLEDHQQRESDAAAKLDLTGLDQLAQRRGLLQNEYDYVTKQLELLGGYQSPEGLRRALDKARSDLQNLAGAGYDPAKADKLRAKIAELTEQLGPQQTLGFGEKGGIPATREQITPTGTEYNRQLAAQQRALQRGAPMAEAEEQDVLAQAEAQRQAAATEAQRVAKVSPVMAELQRIGAKPAVYVGEEERRMPRRAEQALEAEAAKPPTQYPSAALGQMQQLLTGQDVTYTAEETQPKAPYQRVPSEGYKLFPRQTAPERPVSPAELQERLTRALARKDLSDDAYAVLRRAEQVLPTEATAEHKDFLNLLDQQLSRIESGAEGVAQPGAQRRVTLQQFPAQGARANIAEATQANKDDINKARWRQNRFQENLAKGMPRQAAAADAYAYSEAALAAQKAASPYERTTVEAPPVQRVKERSVIEPTTIRGPSAVAPALSLSEQLEPEIARRERAAQETAGQMELFPEKAQGELFEAPKAVAQEVQQDRDIVTRYNEEMPELNKRIARLSNIVDKIGKLEKAATSDANLAQTQQELADLQRTAQSLTLVSPTAVTHVPTREAPFRAADIRNQMEVIENRRKAREDIINKSSKMSEAEKAALNAQVNDVSADMQRLQMHHDALLKFIAQAQAQMDVAQAQQRVEDANARLAQPGLFPNERAAQLGAVRVQAQKDLTAARAQATALNREYLEAFRKSKDAERMAKAQDAERRRRESVERSKAEQARLERLQARPGLASNPQVEFPAITIAEREARENKLDPEKFKLQEGLKLKGTPANVLKGYESEITRLRTGIESKQQAAFEQTLKEQPKYQEYLQTLARYNAAKTSEARAAIEPELTSLEGMLRNAAAAAAQQDKFYPGRARDIKALAEALQKKQALQQLITEGYFEQAKQPKVKPPVEVERAAKETQRKEEAAEAATRAEAPTTTGEALTRTEAQKAREAKPTVYSSKGVSRYEGGAARAEQEIFFTAKRRKKQGLELTPLQQFILEENLKSRKPEAAESAEGAEEIETLGEATPEAAARVRETQEQIREEERETGVLAEGTEDIRKLFDDSIKYQAKVETAGTALHGDVVKALKTGDASEALVSLTETSRTPINRAIATRIAPLLANTKVELKPGLTNERGEVVYGAASADGGTIYINPDIGYSEEVLLHEAVHAATERVLQMPEDKLNAAQLAAKKELQRLYEAIKNDKDITSENAKESLSEFVAEAMSNNLLQAQLSQKKWTLGDAWRSFKRILLNMLGIDTPKSMLDAALMSTDTLFNRTLAPTKSSTPLLYKPLKFADADLAAAGEVGSKFIAKNRSWMDSVRANSTGLAFETQLVDRFAGFERLAKLMPSLHGTQMMYYLRMYDQRMNFVSQSVANGALKRVEKKRPDGQKEYLFESQEGPSLKSTVDILKEAKAITGGGQETNHLFTLYLSAIRARDKGFDALHFGTDLTQAELNKAMANIQKNGKLTEIFERARKEYNEYNRGLINFAVECHAMSKDLAAKLLKENDYIPWYRQRNGVAELVIGKEPPIQIGNLAQQPYLHELIGGDKPILDFMTSSVQNTNMLTDMALRNIATKNAAMELVSLDLAKVGKGRSSGPDVVQFKIDGENRFALIDTDKVGIPADILVKGMEGIPTQMPMALRVLGMPARLLRKTVTASPLYAGKQLFRDSLAAPILAGADFAPTLGALREIGSVNKGILERRGVTGGQIFTGTSEDLTRILTRIAEDKPGWTNSLAKWEAISMEADALTRRAQYNSYVKQGLSEMEATLLSLESMNFNKRGASPSVHWANSLVPFFNAQIQSLNVLYKAVTGNLPFNEKLKIQEKLLTRGMMLAAVSLAYTAAMQDDEAYKNATPDQKYGNWFIRVPGFDEPVKLPIPFEVGYIFKALPEALFNIMKNEHGSDEAFKAFNQILLQLIPGGTSMATVDYGRAKIPVTPPIPQALKPGIELALGKSFFTGRDTLTAHEKTLLPEAQFRENTSELAKIAGSMFKISPIALEQLVNGYTGTMGLAFLQALSMGVPAKQSPAQATKRWSDLPVVGGAFQPNDAGGIINNVYERMNEIASVQRTVDDYVNRGEKAKALELLQQRGNEYVASEVANMYTSTMREFTQYETAIRASSLTEDQKRQQLDRVRQAKIHFAEMVRQASDKAIPR